MPSEAAPLQIDISKTALVLIDLQNAITSRQLAPHSPSDVVARSRQLADAMRTKGGTVIFVHVFLDQIARLAADAPSPAAPSPLPPGATDIVEAAGMQSSDILIGKRQWGAFYGTNLEQTLDRRGIETIILGGIATNMGVESTARAAHDAGYALIFAEDAMSTMRTEWHDFPVKNLFPRMGRVRSTEAILAAL